MLKFRARTADQLHHAAPLVHPHSQPERTQRRYRTKQPRVILRLQQPCSLWNTWRLLQNKRRRRSALCRMRRLTVQKVSDQLRTMLQRLAEKSFSSRISLHCSNTTASRPMGTLISMHRT